MMTLSTTRYERKHREAVLNLMFYSRRTHSHLDWYRAATWLDLGEARLWLAWQRDSLAGCIGVSAPLRGTTWVRLLAIHNMQPTAPVLRALWPALAQDCAAEGVQAVSILVVNRWIEDYLVQLGFAHHEEVVTLVKHTPALPAAPASPPLLRDAVLEDVPALRALDHAAFTPPWQMHTDELRQAVRYAASVTLALQEERLVGYQISTRHHTSAHLARLAVAPAQQGQGIGAALLHDLLTRFGRRGVRTMTVNTQQHNVQSLRLYARYEFQRNGFDLPVWQRALP